MDEEYVQEHFLTVGTAISLGVLALYRQGASGVACCCAGLESHHRPSNATRSMLTSECST
jgi:hypothetical protein